MTSLPDSWKYTVPASPPPPPAEPLPIVIQEQSPFLYYLPAEIRLIIYHFYIVDNLFPPEPLSEPGSETTATGTLRRSNDGPDMFLKLSPPLARTCRLAAREMTALLSEFCSITAHVHPVLRSYQDTLGHERTFWSLVSRPLRVCAVTRRPQGVRHVVIRWIVGPPVDKPEQLRHIETKFRIYRQVKASADTIERCRIEVHALLWRRDEEQQDEEPDGRLIFPDGDNESSVLSAVNADVLLFLLRRPEDGGRVHLSRAFSALQSLDFVGVNDDGFLDRVRQTLPQVSVERSREKLLRDDGGNTEEEDVHSVGVERLLRDGRDVGYVWAE